MNQLTLEWVENGVVKTQTIQERQPSKNTGSFRLGRDPKQCDLVLGHPTVSGLHVEIFFHPQENNFWLRNLRATNPPIVDRQRLTQGEIVLSEGSLILLGAMQIKVVAIDLQSSSIPPTLLVTPAVATISRGYQTKSSVPPTKPPNTNYGLQCPNCLRISPYERLEIGCPWCGTSLASAASIIMPPNKN